MQTDLLQVVTVDLTELTELVMYLPLEISSFYITNHCLHAADFLGSVSYKQTMTCALCIFKAAR